MKKIILLSCLLVWLFSNFSAAQTVSVAVNDTIDVYPSYRVVYDILANDIIAPGDSIEEVSIDSWPVMCKIDSNKIFTFWVAYWGLCNSTDSAIYTVTTNADTLQAKIFYRIHDRSTGYLNINNVNALFSASGMHFFKDSAEYQVPKGSGKTSIFSNTLWIGGKDQTGKLHLAAQKYGQGPGVVAAHTKWDWFAGPVMDSVNYSDIQDTVWNYIWNLKKTDIDYHRNHYWEAGYSPIHDILTWPGNGDTLLGESWKLAPFADRNGDGRYDPYDGDYPEIRGDQCLFFIFNDDRNKHSESNGEKLKVEVHGMAYAFDMPGDSALKNSTFLYYKIYNRSSNTYDSTYLGLFTDIDLGWANDDYVGCDVERNMYIGYNGTPVDGSGQPQAYGAHPPKQGVIFLAGPYMDPDGNDNPRFDNQGNQICDYSVNGVNFGDSVADNERYGMTGFMYINNSGSGVPPFMQDPLIDYEYYQLMKGVWKDGVHMTYGGNGHPGAGGTGLECRFLFPALSDSINWGTGCVAPDPKLWTEITAGNFPSDRRGIQSSGPFTFNPGDVQEFDICFLWARDYTNDSTSNKLELLADEINAAFSTNTLPGGNPFYGINDKTRQHHVTLKVYPNPASDFVTGEISGMNKVTLNVSLMNPQGQVIKYFTTDNKKFRVDLSGLPSGVYLLQTKSDNFALTKKVLIVR